MRIYISVDMEGIGGIATLDQVVRGNPGYPRAQDLMTAETNAAIQGAFDAGAESVVVNDSHGTMDNLIHENLDPRARLVFGSPKAQCMAEGLDESFDLALFLGYHAPAGDHGVLAHTFSAHFTEVRLNGRRASELSVNALWAGSFGVPVGMVTGDDIIVAMAEQELPGVGTVVTKAAKGWSAADSVAPSVAREAIRAATADALRNIDQVAPLAVPERLELEVDLPNPTAAEYAALMPGATRLDARTIAMSLSNPAEVMGAISVCYELANTAMRSRLSMLNRS